MPVWTIMVFCIPHQCDTGYHVVQHGREPRTNLAPPDLTICSAAYFIASIVICRPHQVLPAMQRVLLPTAAFAFCFGLPLLVCRMRCAQAVRC